MSSRWGGALGVLAIGAVLALGCASRGNAQPDGAGDNPANGDGLGPPIGAARVWTADSQHISVHCSDFTRGDMQFESDRAKLSSQQLALLDGMRIGSRGQPLVDVLRCWMEITASDGSIAPYVAAQQDAVNEHAPVITFSSFEPFLAAIPCLFSGDQGPQHSVSPDERCMNGIELAPAPGTVDRFLTVTDPMVQHHLTLDKCADAEFAQFLSLQLIGGDDGASGGAPPVLAHGVMPPAPTPEQICLTVDYAFPTAGTYRMRVSIAGALPVSPAHAFLFRFY